MASDGTLQSRWEICHWDKYFQLQSDLSQQIRILFEQLGKPGGECSKLRTPMSHWRTQIGQRFHDRLISTWPAWALHTSAAGIDFYWTASRGSYTASEHYGASIAYSPRSVKHITLHTCCWRSNGSCDIEVGLPWINANDVFSLTDIQSGISHWQVFQLQFWLPFWPRFVLWNQLNFVQALIYESAQLWVFRDVRITIIPAISSLGILWEHSTEEF